MGGSLKTRSRPLSDQAHHFLRGAIFRLVCVWMGGHDTTSNRAIFTLLSKIGPIRFVLTQVLKKKNWFPFSGERAKVGIISEYIINLVPSLKKCLKSLKFQSIYNEKIEDSACATPNQVEKGANRKML